MSVKLTVCGRLADAEDHTGVLHRKEAFGHDAMNSSIVADERGDRHQQGDQAGDRRITFSVPAVRSDDGVEDLLRPVVEARLLRVRLVFQDSRAHHRRQRERDHR